MGEQDNPMKERDIDHNFERKVNFESDSLSLVLDDLKKELSSGEARAFVHSRVNLDITEDGRVELTRHEGYQNTMLRGVDDKQAETLRGLISYVDDAGLPRESVRSNDTLYVRSVNPEDSSNYLKDKYVNSLEKELGLKGKRIIEFRYKQPLADTYNRTSEKMVYLLLPENVAEKFGESIENGDISANDLRDRISEIFISDQYGREFYDINLQDRDGNILKRANKPDLKKIYFQETKPGGERGFLCEEPIIIDSPELTKKVVYEDQQSVVAQINDKNAEKSKNVSRENILLSEIENPNFTEDQKEAAKKELAGLRGETVGDLSDEYSQEYQKVKDAREAVLSGKISEEEGNRRVFEAYDRMTEIRKTNKFETLPFDELPDGTATDVEGNPSSETAIPDYLKEIGEGEYQYIGKGNNEDVILKPEAGEVKGEFKFGDSASNKDIEHKNENGRNLSERLKFLPEHEQLSVIRDVLLQIESSSSSTTTEYMNAQLTKQLDSAIELLGLPDYIASEIEARLSLHECGVLMRRADGKIKIVRRADELDPENRTTIPTAISAAYGNNRQLEGTKLETLLERGKMKDYEVGLAWDILQDINFERNKDGEYVKYQEWIKKTNVRNRNVGGVEHDTKAKRWVEGEQSFGETDANFFKDNKEDRKQDVEATIIEELTNAIKISPQRRIELNIHSNEEELKYRKNIAKQSYRMAEKAFYATLESSSLNRELNLGPDQLAECMGFKFSRQAAKKKNQLVGPLIHLNRIEGFGNSYLRRFLGKEDYSPLYVDEIRRLGYRKLDSGSYQTFAAQTLAYNEMRELLLDRNVDKSKLLDPDLSWYRKVNGYIARTDPNAFKEGSMGLEYWIIAGILDVQINAEGIRNPDNIWTSVELVNFQKRVLEPLSPGDPKSSFLTIKQWDSICELVGYKEKDQRKEWFARGFVEGMFGRRNKS